MSWGNLITKNSNLLIPVIFTLNTDTIQLIANEFQKVAVDTWPTGNMWTDPKIVASYNTAIGS